MLLIANTSIALDISDFQKEIDHSVVSLTKDIEKKVKDVERVEDTAVHDIIPSHEKSCVAQEIVANFDSAMKELPNQSDNPAQSDFYIFISSSMPDAMIKQLLIEAKRYNGILVLQGLIQNSMKHTVSYLSRFVQNDGDGIVIDPTLFKQFDIKIVPSFVLSDGKAHDIIKGVMTPYYALSEFQSKGDLKLAAHDRLGK